MVRRVAVLILMDMLSYRCSKLRRNKIANVAVLILMDMLSYWKKNFFVFAVFVAVLILMDMLSYQSTQAMWMPRYRRSPYFNGYALLSNNFYFKVDY